MSKSKGNVIDPLVMMDQYGTDAWRFTLAMLAAQGRDIILPQKRIEGYRTFCNKIWNATRFILMNLGEDFQERELTADELETFDRRILHRLNETIRGVRRGFEDNKFNDSAHAIYTFWWARICDLVYRTTKQRLYAKEGASSTSPPRRSRCYFMCSGNEHSFSIRLCLFITEEIWTR